MRRQVFVRALATAGGGAFVASCERAPDPPQAEAAKTARPKAAAVRTHTAPATLKPPRLRKGDTVGIVAPAGPVRQDAEIEHATRQAEMLGLKPLLSENIRNRYGYLAGSDAARAHDFNAFAANPRVRAIFAIRGGYGTMRILDAIDYDALVADPKVVLGFSDITALLNAITWRTGLITFHGPVAGHATLTQNLLRGIERATMSAEPLGEMHAPQSRILAEGVAHGQLTGGNLSLVAALSGTPYAIPCDDKILLLEDVKEAPYRVDRMLTQLKLNGDLARVAGIALGHFPYCVAKSDDLPSLTIEETLEDRLSEVGKPVIADLQFGHIEDQWTLPIGITATLDVGRHVLSIAEPAVA